MPFLAWTAVAEKWGDVAIDIPERALRCEAQQCDTARWLKEADLCPHLLARHRLSALSPGTDPPAQTGTFVARAIAMAGSFFHQTALMARSTARVPRSALTPAAVPLP
jgi:hypothetical protein